MVFPLIPILVGAAVGGLIGAALSEDEIPNLVDSLSSSNGIPLETANTFLFRGKIKDHNDSIEGSDVVLLLGNGEKVYKSSSNNNSDSDGDLFSSGVIYNYNDNLYFECLFFEDSLKYIDAYQPLSCTVLIIKDKKLISKTVFTFNDFDIKNERESLHIMNAIAWHIVLLARSGDKESYKTLSKVAKESFDLNAKGIDQLKRSIKYQRCYNSNLYDIYRVHQNVFKNESRISKFIKSKIALLIAKTIDEDDNFKKLECVKILEVISGIGIDDGIITVIKDFCKDFYKENIENEEKINKYYRLLGIKKGSSRDEIKKAYYKIIKEEHPDTVYNSSDEIKLKKERRAREINEAYTALLKRAA